MIDCLIFILLLLLFLFFSCNYFSQGEITTLGSVGGPDIIRDVVVGMVEGPDIIRDVVVGVGNQPHRRRRIEQ